MHDIPNVLDTILQSSLWQRRLNRREDDLKPLFDAVLVGRAKYIWNNTTLIQRKGYFLAGVGFETGQKLDEISQQANALLVEANAYIHQSDSQSAIRTITALAGLLFSIPPFKPLNLPDNWADVLSVWLRGEPMRADFLGNIDDVLKFIEDGLVYRLPWGMEAVRVRAIANGDEITESRQINEYRIVPGDSIDEAYELGLVVPAVENGTLNRSAAMLMQAGFNSRRAAIHAITSTNASFTSSGELKAWLNSQEVFDLAIRSDWPTSETSSLWWKFVEEFQPASNEIWNANSVIIPIDWSPLYLSATGAFVKLWNDAEGFTQVLGSDGESIGALRVRYNLFEKGVYRCIVAANTEYLDATYWGAGDTPFEAEIT